MSGVWVTPIRGWNHSRSIEGQVTLDKETNILVPSIIAAGDLHLKPAIVLFAILQYIVDTFLDVDFTILCKNRLMFLRNIYFLSIIFSKHLIL